LPSRFFSCCSRTLIWMGSASNRFMRVLRRWLLLRKSSLLLIGWLLRLMFIGLLMMIIMLPLNHNCFFLKFQKKKKKKKKFKHLCFVKSANGKEKRERKLIVGKKSVL